MSRRLTPCRPLPGASLIAAVLASALAGCGTSHDAPHARTEPATPPGSPWTTIAVPGVDETSSLAAGPDGAILVVGEADDRGTASPLIPVAADGTLGRVGHVPTLLHAAGWNDRVVYLRGSADGRRIGVSSGPLDGSAGGPEAVLRRGGPGDATLAVGSTGGVLVGFAGGVPDDVLEYAGRRIRLYWTGPGPGRRWTTRALPGRRQLLATDVDARGVATLLLERTITVRHRGPAGRTSVSLRFLVTTRALDLRSGRLGIEHVLDRSSRDVVDGSIAVDAHGEAVLAWGSQDGGEEAEQTYLVRATTRFGGRLTPTQTLDASGDRERPGTGPVTAMDDAGGATVAWTQAYRSPDFDVVVVPRVATASGPGRFGPRKNLLRSGRVTGAAASGTTTLVAVTGSGGPHRVTRDGAPRKDDVGGVVVRSGGLAFGPLEPVGRSSVVAGPEVGLMGGPPGLRAVWRGHVARRAG